jgi:hypothetical protein
MDNRHRAEDLHTEEAHGVVFVLFLTLFITLFPTLVFVNVSGPNFRPAPVFRAQCKRVRTRNAALVLQLQLQLQLRLRLC